MQVNGLALGAVARQLSLSLPFYLPLVTLQLQAQLFLRDKAPALRVCVLLGCRAARRISAVYPDASLRLFPLQFAAHTIAHLHSTPPSRSVRGRARLRTRATVSFLRFSHSLHRSRLRAKPLVFVIASPTGIISL